MVPTCWAAAAAVLVVVLVAVSPAGTEAAIAAADGTVHASAVIAKHPNIRSFHLKIQPGISLSEWKETALLDALEVEGASAYTEGDTFAVRWIDEDGALMALRSETEWAEALAHPGDLKLNIKINPRAKPAPPVSAEAAPDEAAAAAAAAAAAVIGTGRPAEEPLQLQNEGEKKPRRKSKLKKRTRVVKDAEALKKRAAQRGRVTAGHGGHSDEL